MHTIWCCVLLCVCVCVCKQALQQTQVSFLSQHPSGDLRNFLLPLSSLSLCSVYPHRAFTDKKSFQHFSRLLWGTQVDQIVLQSCSQKINRGQLIPLCVPSSDKGQMSLWSTEGLRVKSSWQKKLQKQNHVLVIQNKILLCLWAMPTVKLILSLYICI